MPIQPGGNNLLTHITTRPHSFDNLLSPNKNAVVKVEYADAFKLSTPSWDTVIDNYKNDKTILNSSSSDELINKLLDKSLDIKQVVSNKHKSWIIENEYRLFGNMDTSQAIGSAINSLTFGLNVSNNDIRYLTSIIARFYGANTVELYKMAISDGTLVRIPFEMNDASPRASQSHVIFQ